MGSVAKSFMRKGFLIYEEMRKYLVQLYSIWGGRWSFMTLQPLPSEFPYIWVKFYFLFYQCTCITHKYLSPVHGWHHGLINYIDTKAKCSLLKNLPVKGLCGRCLSEFIDWRYSQSCWYNIYDPALWTIAPLTLSLVQSPPLPCVNKCTEYTYTVCWGGGGIWDSGPQTNKHLPQSSFTGQIFRWRHLAFPSISLIFLRLAYSWGLWNRFS
jgi:hypothetical protein